MFIDFRRDPDPLNPGRHRVVIVGGGFGGTYAARALRFEPVTVTLIDRRNHTVFNPMLYQAATGAVADAEIAQPLRRLLRNQPNTRVLLGEAVGIDSDRRAVTLSDGGSVEYDTLIVASGTRHAYPGAHPEWSDLAPGLTTVEDATEIRRRVLLAFESAEREADPERRRAWLTFVVVGGGPTGVELAGAVAELARDALGPELRTVEAGAARVILVEMADRLLTDYPATLSAAARRDLEALGVTVRTETSISEMGSSHVTVRMGPITERIDARTALWAAGTRPTAFGRRLAGELGAAVDRTGRILVEPDLSVPGRPEVLVIGDMAAVRRPDGSFVPAVAQGGIQGGRHAGRVVAARLRGQQPPTFRYRDKGELAMIGRFRTVARLPFVRLSGPLAWLVWLGVHLWYLQGFQNRVLVGVRWMWTMLRGERGSRLITGPGVGAGALPAVGLLADEASASSGRVRAFSDSGVVGAGHVRWARRSAGSDRHAARDRRRFPVTSRRLSGSHW
jgi:NADH dehydrogenase